MGHDLILEVSTSHTTTHHSRWNSTGRVISSSQRHLPNKTQHSQQTSLPPAGFEHTISAGERPQSYDLDRAATGTGCVYIYNIYVYYIFYITTTRTGSCWQANIIILFVLEKNAKFWDQSSSLLKNVLVQYKKVPQNGTVLPLDYITAVLFPVRIPITDTLS